MALILLIALAASVYLVYVLEIFKFKRLRGDPAAHGRSRHERARDRRARSSASIETGEFERVAK